MNQSKRWLYGEEVTSVHTIKIAMLLLSRCVRTRCRPEASLVKIRRKIEHFGPRENDGSGLELG